MKNFDVVFFLIIGFGIQSCCSAGDPAYNFTDLNDFTFNVYGNDIGHLYNTQNTWAHVDSFKVLNELGVEVSLKRFNQNSWYYRSKPTGITSLQALFFLLQSVRYRYAGYLLYCKG